MKSRRESRHCFARPWQNSSKIDGCGLLQPSQKRSPSKSRHVFLRILKTPFTNKQREQNRLDFPSRREITMFKRNAAEVQACVLFSHVCGLTRRCANPRSLDFIVRGGDASRVANCVWVVLRLRAPESLPPREERGAAFRLVSTEGEPAASSRTHESLPPLCQWIL